MKTKHLMLFVWFAALLAAAETPRQVYQNALYLECGTGDLAAGLSGYEQVIGAAGEAGLVQAARCGPADRNPVCTGGKCR